MNLHEYQAKEILRKYKLPLLSSKFYENNLINLETDLKLLKVPPWVVKSQIHAGGRGAGKFKKNFNEKGGVQIDSEKNQVFKIANLMINNTLITKQTAIEGKKVKSIYIE